MPKVAWLVDIGYVVKASENRFELDYLEAERLLRERLGPTRSFLFNGFDPKYGISEGLQAFYDAMKRYGMQVRLHAMQSGPPGGNRQRRVDVDFGAHLVWQASLPEIEALVLTTGDQDFIPAVELVKAEFAKRIILFTYGTRVHNDLVAAADDWWLFEDQEARLARR